MSGTYPLDVDQVIAALSGRETGLVRDIVVEWRLPRVLAAVVFGAALGVSGAVFQSLTRNPLASPDVIGFSTGSYTGALVVILVTGGSYTALAGGALVGGILTAAVVYLLAYRRGVQGFRLIIVGIGVSAMLASLNSWMILRADLDVAISAAMWGAGSLGAITWAQVTGGAVVIGVLLVGCAGLGGSLRQLELGDDTAKAQGVSVERARLALVVIGVALTATVTAAAGPISFVALAAPQIARPRGGDRGAPPRHGRPSRPAPAGHAPARRAGHRRHRGRVPGLADHPRGPAPGLTRPAVRPWATTREGHHRWRNRRS
jgi:iron complex transport system permease protein